MNRCRVTLGVFLVAVSGVAGITSVVAGDLYCHRQRTCNKHCLRGYNYGHDTARSGATEFAVANTAIGEGVLKYKPFHFRATALTVDHLHLDQVGLAIYQFDRSTKTNAGRIVATGRITNDGGDGGIIGSNVTIRIRAYVAPTADPNQIPPDAFAVWESEHNLWVSRGRPQNIALVPKPPHLSQPEKLNLHFNQITHLEVELGYQRDR